MPAPSFWDVFSYFGTYIYSMCFISQCSHRMDVHYPVSLYNRRSYIPLLYQKSHISPQSADCILYQPAYSYRIDPRWILFFPSPRNLTETFKSLCIQVPLLQNMRYLLLVILLLTPASQFVKMLTASISLQKNPDSPKSSDSSAGSMIGKLERLIIAMLVIYGEAGAIGFVLAAKSLARYKQFEDQKTSAPLML